MKILYGWLKDKKNKWQEETEETLTIHHQIYLEAWQRYSQAQSLTEELRLAGD